MSLRSSLGVQWLGFGIFIVGVRFNPGPGTKILQASRCGQKRGSELESCHLKGSVKELVSQVVLARCLFDV